MLYCPVKFDSNYMRFIGNKELIHSEVRELLEEHNLTGKNLTLFDAFCGSGAISDALKDSFNIIANDALSWCVMYTRGRVRANSCEFAQLGFDPFAFLNSNRKISKGFFYKNYSPGGSNRMYFTQQNAGRIDYFRKIIETWRESQLLNEDEYAFLIASLLESVSVVSNTAGVYGAFLKHWDSRALKPIEFRKVDYRRSLQCNASFINFKIEDIISDVNCDVLYLDPPYTQNQYGTQYHLFETLVLNDNPKVSAITGSRSTTPLRSDWSKNYKSHILFDKLLAKTKARYIVLSYSKDGFMSKSFIEASMKRYGRPETFICKKIDYKKYTNFKSREKDDHFEYLFFVERKKENEILYESPLNYIGSKAKMASLISRNAPKQFNSFVDAFGGGFNVGINIKANRIIYNDVNHFVTNLVSSFKTTDTYQYILFIKRIINKFKLEPEKVDSYVRVRNYYNSFPLDKRDPRLLYSVLLYGFNQQIRFNSSHDFNNPVGMRWFNDKVLEKMISFSREIKEKNVRFESKDYQDLLSEIDGDTFTYLDPPYLLTNGSYNDGKRGFHGWNAETEKRFFDFVDILNTEGKPFMISYVTEHKGKFNSKLVEWIQDKNYKIVHVDNALGNNRKEILISNYSADASNFQNKEQLSEAEI